MCPKYSRKHHILNSKPQQQGMALIAVIFLMVIMSGAVLMMSRLSDMQNAERALEILGARGQMAAQSGLSWMIYQVADNVSNCGNYNFNLNELDLAGFTVDITCTATSYDEGLTTITTYEMTSSASYQTYDGDSEYVFRQVTAVIELES